MIADHESRRLSTKHRLLACQAMVVLLLGGCGGGGQPPEPLIIDSVFPVRGSELGGSQIQLSGKNFPPGTKVMVGEKECAALAPLSSSTITCTVPANSLGKVDIQAIAPDGRQVTVFDAYTYRPSNLGIDSFGIVAAFPAQGGYREPFTAKLESVLVGFDRSTVTRTWSVGGTVYKEGDSVLFPAGTHTVKLTVRDATGDLDEVSYSILVGPLTGGGTPVSTSNAFNLSSGNTISVVNNGLFPVLNPRFIGAGKPDYVDWARYLNSLGQLAGVSVDASEGSRAKLLEAAWRDLSNATVHVCSPGREDEHINDPALLIRGYGYECCSNAARALAFLGSFLDIPARVRTTLHHEFPEFTVAGNTFILDPDLRFRFWGEGQMPLSAWTTDSAPVSLMNVTSYAAETARGDYFETQAGGTLPFGSSPEYPEEAIRSFYHTDIVADTIWGYRDAFTGSDYLLHPGEKMAFSAASAYTPLQWRNSDGSPTGGELAPPVGKVVFRQLWYASGPRRFERDGGGNFYIPLDDLPFPVQELVFHFSEPIDPKGFWLTAGGEIHQLGAFTSTTWTVSAEQLRKLSSLADLAAVVEKDFAVVAVDIGMQFNPRIFGDSASSLALTYADDSGNCRRNLSVAAGVDSRVISLGVDACDIHVPQRINTSYELLSGNLGTSVISSYGNSYQGSWGLAAAAGVRAHAEISLPRTPGLPGLLRTGAGGHFADWQIYDGEAWIPLVAADLTSSQWITLPSTSSSMSRLRVTLRRAPSTNVTYLAYLSLTEGQDTPEPMFASAPPTMSSGGED